MTSAPKRALLAAALVASACSGDDLEIVTGALVDARVGTAYSSRLVAKGGDGSYAWTLVDGTVPDGLTIATSGLISGTPREGGSFEFEVSVRSGEETERETFELFVDGAAALAIDTPSTLPMATEGVAYSATIVASGGTQSAFTWAITSGALPEGMTLAESGTPMSTVSGTPRASGDFAFSITVTDDDGATATVPFTLTVSPSADALAFTTVALPDGVVDIEYEGLLAVTNNTGAVTWTIETGVLPAGLMLASTGEATAAITGTPTEEGTFTVEIRATDEEGATASETFGFSISLDPLPLVFEDVELPVGRIGATYAASVTARGGTNRGYTWSIRSGSLPRGLVLQTEGTPSTTILGTPESARGLYDFVLGVVDSQGNEATVNLRIVLEAPRIQILNATLPGATVGVPYDVELIAAGGDGGPYAFAAGGGSLPPGLSVDPSGAINGTPTTDGAYTFVILATDGTGAVGQTQLMIEIDEILAIPSTTLPAASANVAYSANLVAVGGTPPYTWSAAGSLPAGLSITNGTLAGTPTMAGSFSLDLTVTDADNAQATATFALVVHPALAIATTTLPDGNAFDVYSAAIVVNGGAPGALTWSTTSLPSGLALVSDGSSMVTIEGTPDSPGAFTFTVDVTDTNGASASRMFDLTITGNLTIQEFALPGAVVNQPYTTTLTAAGGSGTGFMWQITSGALPAGLALNGGSPSATISGIATMIANATFDVRVTDDLGGTFPRTYTLTTAVAPLTITTQTIAPTPLCEDVSTQLVATGGTGTGVTWSVTSGSLPPGLALDASTGSLAGRAAAPGTYTFTIAATDDGNFSDEAEYTITIAAVPTPGRYVALSGDLTLNNRLDVYVVSVCGASPGPLVSLSPTAPHAADVSALEDLTQLSPDGSKIAFVGDFTVDGQNDLYVVDLLGATPGAATRVNGTMVTGGNVTDFYWSPDSEKIAYVADQDLDDRSELFLVDAAAPTNAGLPEKISAPMATADNDITPNAVFWSPDSNRIAYHADAGTDGVGEIFLVDASDLTQIGAATKVHGDLGANNDCTTDIVWAPDSSGIAFRCDLVVTGRFEPWFYNPSVNQAGSPTRMSNQVFDLFDDVLPGSMRFAPTMPVRLIYLADLTYDGSYEVWHSTFANGVPGPFVRVMSGLAPSESITRAIWSHDGTKIAVRGDLIVDGRFGLSVADLSAGIPTATVALRPFTTGAADLRDTREPGTSFEFSPDDRYLVFIADAAAPAEYRLWSADLDVTPPAISSESDATMDGARDVSSFAISPDSTRVLYRGDVTVEDRYELKVVGLAGNAPLMATNVHPPLPGDGDVGTTFGWRNDGAAAFYLGDTRIESVVEASMVRFDGVTAMPLPPMLLHPASSILEDVTALELPRAP